MARSQMARSQMARSQMARSRVAKTFDELVGLIEFMRSKGGCAWDREQTIDDFRKYLKEESEEALAAIEKKDYENLKEELGDIMWHIIFISQIAREEGLFDIYDVMDGLKKKIIRRHPHVFGDVKADSAEEVVKLYKRIKQEERK